MRLRIDENDEIGNDLIAIDEIAIYEIGIDEIVYKNGGETRRFCAF